MFPSPDHARSDAEARVQAGRLRYQKHAPAPSRMRTDEAWVHWEYQPDDWALFEHVDWRVQRLVFWGLVVCSVASVIGAILPWFIFLPTTDTGPLLSVFLPALLVWCVCVPLTMSYLFTYLDAKKRHLARQQEARTVTFSREGLWEAGTFFSLDKLLEANLKKVTLTLDPPVLHFRLMRWHLGKNWRASPTNTTLHVPVPRGQEEEAGFLQARFQAEVIQARAQREDRLAHPPEPAL